MKLGLPMPRWAPLGLGGEDCWGREGWLYPEAVWFQIGKGVHQGCILSLCLFNLYAEYIMQNIGLDEAQIGTKTAGGNINNLR